VNYQQASDIAIAEGLTNAKESCPRPPRRRTRQAVSQRTPPTGLELHVGRRLRERRTLLGLSQEQLAQLLGITYQQIHKYERGANRISAGRLFEAAQVLSVPIDYFFAGVDAPPTEAPSKRQRMCLDLVRNFAQIDNEPIRLALSQMARVLTE